MNNIFVNVINYIWAGIIATISPVFDIIDTRKIVRRLFVIGVFYLTFHFAFWAMHYAETSPRTGTEIAMIITTLWTPINVLLGFVFHRYDSSRQKDNNGNGLSTTGQ